MFSTPSAGAARFSRRTLLSAAALGAGLLVPPRIPTTQAGEDTDDTATPDATWLFGPLQGRTPGSVPDAELSTVFLPHSAVYLHHHNWVPSDWERTWLYRKHFAVSPGARHFLRFEGAATTTTPVLNSRPLPTHAGGYLPFEYEITALVGARNTLDVVVDGRFDPTAPPNHGPGSTSSSVDFWQPAGLYREASVLSRPTDHIADVVAEPAEVLDEARRHLDVHCTLDFAAGCRGARVDVTLLRDGAVVTATSSVVGTLPPGRHDVALHVGDLRGITLWDTENPTLYDVTVSLTTVDGEVDERSVRTGFREVRFDRDGFRLNGRRRPLFGLNRHQLFPYAGAAMPERVQRHDAEVLRRDLNCTMVRCSHYPPHPSFLDACDEIGLLVWEEPPGWQHVGGPAWRANARRDLRAMIERDRNHPSVAVWGVRLNETRDDPSFHARAEGIARSLDGSRPTAGAIRDTAYATVHFEHEVFGYNDYGHRADRGGRRTPVLSPPRTDHAYLVTEAVGTLAGPAKAYRREDSPTVRQDQALAHARVHDRARSDPRYSGLLGWSGYDYPSGNGNTANGVKATGVVDLFRIPKPGAAFYRAQVDPQHRAVLEPSFSWDFHPSGPVTELGRRAAIWSNLDQLEVFLDNVHHQSLLPARREFPHLPHPPFFADFSAVAGSPELRVDGHLAGRRVLSRRFSADRNRDRLALAVDDPVLLADGRDATRAEFRVVDAHGADRLGAGGRVDVDLEGPAALIGPRSLRLDETGGAAAVWVRTLPGATGGVRISAQHDALGRAQAHLDVTRAPGRSA